MTLVELLWGLKGYRGVSRGLTAPGKVTGAPPFFINVTCHPSVLPFSRTAPHVSPVAQKLPCVFSIPPRISHLTESQQDHCPLSSTPYMSTYTRSLTSA